MLNICLLSKWIFRLLSEDGIWQQLLKRKYLKNSTLAQTVMRPGDSQFWSGLMEPKDHLLPRGKFKVKNGEQIRFWEDWWLGTEPLMNQFPTLYNIARKKNQTVASVVSSNPLNISFRRALVGGKLRMWLEVVVLLVNVNLTDAGDIWEWKLDSNSVFFLSKPCAMSQ